ncbi:MAG TPA: DNA polymerase IV [Acidimicrobiales bacterium]|nr:DNA polymerase IV [Acidimicrobiales bacterium]
MRSIPRQASGTSATRTALDVVHVDMDCFYAAVEMLDDPSLAGRPVIVGGTGLRGVVAACSYEARASGVHSAMPMAEARRRCPQAVVLGGRHDRYGEVSAQLHSVFHEFTPVVEPIALDEAFLDVSGSHRLFGTSLEIASAIRQRVRDQLHLDCSVGVGRSKLIAKLASREAKPRAAPNGPRPGRGVVAVSAEEEIGFLHPRPVSDLWGVGPRTAARLRRYGIHTIGDLASLDGAALRRLVGQAAGLQLHALASGQDDRPVVADRVVKSIGHEETFAVDRHDAVMLRRELVRLSDSVGSRLRAASVVGRTVTLKVRFGDFSTITRSRSLPGPLLSASEIAQVSGSLLDGVDVSAGVRLIGVSVSSLEPRVSAGGRQLELLSPGGGARLEPGAQAGRPQATRATERREGEPGPPRVASASQVAGEGAAVPPEAVSQGVAQAVARGEVDTAVGAIRERYGADAVGPAAIAGPKGLRVKRLGDTQWGPSAADGDGGRNSG